MSRISAKPSVLILNAASLPRVRSAGVARDRPGTRYPAHTLLHTEIDYITSGKTESMVNGQPLTMQAPGIYFFCAGDVTAEGRAVDDYGQYVCRWVAFDWPPARAKTTRAISFPRSILLPLHLQGEVHRHFSLLLEIFAAQTPGWELRAGGALLLLLAALAAAPEVAAPTLSAGVDRRLMVSHSFMERNLAKRMRVAEIVEAARLSEDYFERLFRRAFGLSPLRYLNNLRLHEARRLLASQPGLTVREASRQAGFADAKYFARLFRREFKMSPREYRARLSLPWHAPDGQA